MSQPQPIYDSNGQTLEVNSGEGCLLTLTLNDEDGNQLDSDSLLTILMTIVDTDGNIINSRNDTNVKNAGPGTVAADGTLTLRLEAADNTNSASNNWDKKNHYVRLKWTWNDGVAVRTGAEAWYYYLISTP